MPTTITISEFQPGPGECNFTGTTFKLRRYYNQDWTDVDGVFHAEGVVGSSTGFFDEINGTLSSNTPTVPAFSATPTDNPQTGSNVQETWQLWDQAGTARNVIFEGFIPSTPSPITFGALLLLNHGQTLFESDRQTRLDQWIQSYIDTVVGLLRFATSVIAGWVRLSVAAADVSDPVAVGDNDPRVAPSGAVYWAAHYDSFDDAVLSMGSSVPVRLIVSELMTVTNPTIPATVQLEFVGAGALQLTTGMTVTHRGSLLAARVSIFRNALAGQGTISFSGNLSIAEIYPEWWGAIPGVASSTIQMAAFQRAVDTCLVVRLAQTGLDGTGYSLNNSTSPLMLNNSTLNTASIVGMGGLNLSFIKFTSTAKPGIQIDYLHAGAPSVLLKDFYIRGAAKLPTGDVDVVTGNFGIYVPGFRAFSAASNANPVSLTLVNHGLITGTSITISGGTGAWAAINGTFTPTVTSADTFTIPVNSTGLGALAGNAGINRKISNLVLENVQVDYFGDSNIRIQGETGPVSIINCVSNDSGGNALLLTADSNSPNQGPQDVTISGGSFQGQDGFGSKGGIAAIGVDSAILSLTIREVDVELRQGQTKPLLHFEQVHGALVQGVTLSGLVNSLSVGDANVYLADGVYGCTFIGNTNAVAGTGIHNVHSAGVTQSNKFIGGQYSNNAAGTGYLFKEDAGGNANRWDAAFVSTSTYAAGHAYAPMTSVDVPFSLGTIATTGNTDGYFIVPFDAFITGVDFSSTSGLAANNTNYITFSATNIGQAGAGTNDIVAAINANTTKVTGGSAITANTKRSFTVNGTTGIWPLADALLVAKGDRIFVRAAATGTLANTVTFSSLMFYMVRLMPTGP